MIKVEVIEDFLYKEFAKLKDLERASAKNKAGYLYKGDTFTCDKEMADYLLGDNPIKKAVVKVIEVKPVKKEVKAEETISEELETKVKEQQAKLAKVDKPKKKNKK